MLVSNNLKKAIVPCLFVFLFCFSACKREDKFETLGTNLAFPVSVQASPTGQYFYVLNADFDRLYNSGSVLVFDEEGKEVSAVKAPRLGRGFALNSKHLVSWFVAGDEESDTSLIFYDISDETQPKPVKEFGFKDADGLGIGQPLSVVLPSDPVAFPYFAMTNNSGGVFIGEYDSEGQPTTIRKVRSYGSIARGALFLDEVNSVLLAFATDVSEQTITDKIASDEVSYNSETEELEKDKANEIPDDYEENEFRRRSSTGQREVYQVAVYNIAQGKTNGFPYKERSFENRDEFESELKSVYFTLRDRDAAPDTQVEVADKTLKHFRSNFSSAFPDPRNNRVFYLAHRGKKSDDSAYSNNVVKVTIVGNLSQVTETSVRDDLFTFERIYGYSDELDPDNHFPGQIRIVQISGVEVLVVNHFKDLVNFGSEASFGISAKALQGFEWHDEVRSTSQGSSYFQFGVNQRGKVLATSVYGNALLPLQIVPGVGLKQGWGELRTIR